MRETICDQCGQAFVMEGDCFGSIRKGELVVRYLRCPACGANYQILTTDDAMRGLIEQRNAIQLKLRAAHKKRFRKETIQGYLREMEQIQREQEARLPALRAAGEKILWESGSGEVNP